MLRAGLLYLSEHKQVFRFIRGNSMAQRLASRFVAGETLDTAVAAVRDLNARNIAATLDLLGESVSTPDAACAATAAIIRMQGRIAAEQLRCNVSIKLTQLGLDLDHGLVQENVRQVLERGRALDSFVRIDMESGAHTQRTLDLFMNQLHPAYGDGVGIVIQSYLYRSRDDVERLIAQRARVRLCKGAYQEPPELAFPSKKDVDRNYAQLMERLIERGNYVAVATHDQVLIDRARRFATARAIPPSQFEFQLLYGVRRDLQQELVREGFNVRVYVPFGTQWYPYLMRRLAERPANIAFLLGNVVKEGLR